MPDGLLVLDKPHGVTSRAAVDRALGWFPRGTKLGHTGTLDPLATGILVLEAIQQVNEELGTTTAVITHNAAVAGMADRVVSLSDGRIVSDSVNERKVKAGDLNW